ncbi:MAG: heavy metal translocating P-type ATPase [Bacteroidota bacterium]
MATPAAPSPAVSTPPPASSIEAACAHCGLPVGAHPVRSDEDALAFCCTGCAVVYEALAGLGWGETYYRLKAMKADTQAPMPAQTSVDALALAELDTDTYLQAHTHETSDGLRETRWFLDGVHCVACLWLVERLPTEVSGVHAASLDLARAQLRLVFDPERVRLSEVARWLARFGYRAHPVRTHRVLARSAEERSLLIRMGVTWALAGNVMLLAFTLYSGLDAAADAALYQAARVGSFLVSVPALLYGAAPFFRRAWASLRLAVAQRDVRMLHMDTPIALGLSIGWGHSAWAALTGQGEIWFDSLTVLVAALLTARWLQLRSQRLARDASERLLALLPSMVRHVRADGTLELIAVEELRPGDVVEVPPGEVIPVDGRVTEGVSALNRAVLTGESEAVPCDVGDAVEAGATNLQAPLQVRVEAAGAQSRVGRLMAWVRDQEDQRPEVVLWIDRWGGVFVAVVLALAMLTAAAWWWLAPGQAYPHVVALLVITCPCALSMATPLFISVATGRAARQGIFVKSAAATERLTQVQAVVLDKTGTLTEGQLALVEWEGPDEVLDAAATLEQAVPHPIAVALLQDRFPGEACALTAAPSVRVTTGQGVEGWFHEQHIIVGRPAWVLSRAAATPAQQSRLADVAARGMTPVAVARDGQVAAVLGFADRIRPDVAHVIAQWQAAGLAVHLLSGDHPDVVQRVADQLGIRHASGQATPEDKRAYVDALQERQVVAMVGDGVNDAAALRAADIGIAVQGGATASLVAADVFLVRPGLQPVADVVQGAGTVMRGVRRMLQFSLVYNIGGAAAAMLGLVTPVVAAVAMPISSLVVVLAAVFQRSYAGPRPGRRGGFPPGVSGVTPSEDSL